MDAEDLIARVYPNSGKDRELYAATAIEASPFYVPPQHQKPKQEVQYGRDDRETTEPPDEPGDKKASEFDGKPCIEVRFSKIPRSSHGVLFGCSDKCDVILPNIKGPSNYHFCLTFDEQNRFIVEDLDSGIGTEVTYDNKGKGTRRKFNWIVGGDENAHQHKNVIIKVDNHIQFQVVAAEHEIECQSYIDNVKEFRQGSATKEGLMDDLDIFRKDTELPTEAHTPGEGSIYVKKKIGEGGFGVAIHCWNVSTGSEFVIKKPSNEVMKKIVKHDKYRKRWKEEADHLRNLTHPSIIELLDVVDNPPGLHLEYVRGGPLSKLTNITIPESVLVLTQCLSALAYLHGEQLAHRDISPSNILVRSREPFDVVLADFGLCKSAAELRTRCGTTPYAAPEIFEDSSIKHYSAAVDVWSLGVVACKVLRILPSYSEHMEHLERNTTELSWCNMVVDSLGQLYRRRPDSLKGFLLASMLVISPEGRNSARGCHERIRELPDLIVNDEACDRISDILWREGSLVYSSHTDTNEESTIRLRRTAPLIDAHDADNDEQSTDGVSSIDSSSSDCETRRRSAAPPPSSHRLDTRPNLKRSTIEMAPQSPRSKRRGRGSVSQLLGYPGAHMIDAEVQEAAEAAVLLQNLKNGVYQGDNLPDPPLETIPSWHPWNPFEDRPFSWEGSIGGVHRGHDEAAETDASSADRPCSQSRPEERSRSGRTTGIAQRSESTLSISGVLNSSVLGSPLAELEQYRNSAMSHRAAIPSETAETRNPKAMPINDKGVSKPMTRQSSNPSPPQSVKSLPTVPAGGKSISKASHLSTREVLSDHRQPDIWYMVLRRHRVSMRKSDFQLHAGQILKALDLIKTRRDSLLYKLKGFGLKATWVPFRDGVFLCQATGLSEELQPLLTLSLVPQPNPAENYFLNITGFATLAWQGHIIAYQPSKQTINATSLLRLITKPKEHLERFLQDNPWINARQCTASIHRLLNGTYISEIYIEALCEMLGIDESIAEFLKNAFRQASPPPANRPQQIPEISTPSIDGDLIFVRVGQRVVSLSKNNYDWNLSEILAASDLCEYQVDRLRLQISDAVQLHEEMQEGVVRHWISFIHGVKLISYLGLREKMDDLISMARFNVLPTPDPEYMSFDYHATKISFSTRGEKLAEDNG